MAWSTAVAFFLVAVAYKVPWTAISSLLAQFSQQFGPRVLLYLNLAYFVPSIPVLALQSLVQERLERHWGVPATALARLVLGYGGLALLCALFPSFCTTLPRLLGATAAVGVLYGLCFGTSYQLVARFPPGATVALTTGFVSCGVVVLLLDLVLKRGPFYTAAALPTLFRCVALQVLLGLLAALTVLKANWARLSGSGSVGPASGEKGGRGIISIPLGTKQGNQGMRLGWGGMRQRLDSSANGSSPRQRRNSHDIEAHDTVDNDSEGQPLLPQRMHDPWQANKANNYSTSGIKQSSSLMGLLRLLSRIHPAALALGLSVGTSMALFPFFTYVSSTGLLGKWLPQALFYVRLAGDIAGRILPGNWAPTSKSSSSSGKGSSSLRPLLALAAVKTALTPMLIAALTAPRVARVLGGDLGLVAAVGLYWVLSGRINTAAYVAAPMLVAGSQKAQAGSLMAFCFQSACLAGLLAAFALQGGFVGGVGVHAAGGHSSILPPAPGSMPVGLRASPS